VIAPAVRKTDEPGKCRETSSTAGRSVSVPRGLAVRDPVLPSGSERRERIEHAGGGLAEVEIDREVVEVPADRGIGDDEPRCIRA